MTESAPAEPSLTASLKDQTIFLLIFLALLWGIAAIDLALNGSLRQWGVIPRSLSGLLGIVFAPFLHDGFSHLASNSIPLFVLGWLTLLHGPTEFVKAVFAATLIGGAGTWLVGSGTSVHVGSSVLIFGFFGYLALRGLFERSVKGILISTLVIFIYGGMIFGVLPTDSRVSWEMHLFGAIGGAWAARSVRQDGSRPKLDPTDGPRL